MVFSDGRIAVRDIFLVLLLVWLLRMLISLPGLLFIIFGSVLVAFVFACCRLINRRFV